MYQSTYPENISALMFAYLRDTRPHLVKNVRGDALFTGWRSAGISQKNWGLRSQRARRTLIPSPTIR
jgi:hypothetical protein